MRRLGVDALLIRAAVPLVSTAIAVLICSGVYRVLASGRLRTGAALAGGVVAGLILEVTPTVAGYYLRHVAGQTPVERFLMLAGVLITCYLASLCLLLGAGVTARVQLGHRSGNPGGQWSAE